MMHTDRPTFYHICQTLSSYLLISLPEIEMQCAGYSNDSVQCIEHVLVTFGQDHGQCSTHVFSQSIAYLLLSVLTSNFLTFKNTSV